MHRYSFEGTRRRLAIGTYPLVGLADARAECAKAEDMRRRGLDPAVKDYDVKGTVSTLLSDMGTAPHIVEKCLGHKLPKIMATYNQHEWMEERRDALNRWAEKIEILTGEKSNVIDLDSKRHA